MKILKSCVRCEYSKLCRIAVMPPATSFHSHYPPDRRVFINYYLYIIMKKGKLFNTHLEILLKKLLIFCTNFVAITCMVDV